MISVRVNFVLCDHSTYNVLDALFRMLMLKGMMILNLNLVFILNFRVN